MHISTATENETLDELVEGRIPVVAYLMNGFQLKGTVLKHDDAVAILETDGHQQIVYKHAISTFSPARPLKCLKTAPRSNF